MSTTQSQPSSQDLDAEWKPKNRPQSTIALNFSAALDDLFKLNGIGALEESVEQKQSTLQFQKTQLESLDAQLRETDQRLKRLEASHKRHQSTVVQRRQLSQVFSEDGDSSGDSDTYGRSSPQNEEEAR